MFNIDDENELFTVYEEIFRIINKLQPIMHNVIKNLICSIFSVHFQ